MTATSTEQRRIAALRDKLRTQVLHAENHYELLGVPPVASEAVIRGAHRYMASAFHPDRCGLADASDLMARVNVAYSCLTDAKERRKYDAIHKTHEDKCLTCGGRGVVLRQRGFKAKVETPCPTCGGSGCQ